LNIPFYEEVLLKVSASTSQTKQHRFERWKNVEEMFVVNNQTALKNMHILLIDDVITTGATLEACYLALKKVDNIRISIASIAYTK